MGMNFPDVPTNGQVFGIYTWDGEKWVVTPVTAGGGITQADADIRYVNIPGDTMTGTLNVTTAAGYGVTLTGTAPAHVYGLAVAAGSGGFTLDDVTRGVPLLSISATTGAVSVGSSFGSSQGTITAGSGLTTGTYYFGNSGTKSLSYDGTNFNLIGGNLNVGAGPASYASLTAGYIATIATATTGGYYFGGTGTKYLNYDGTNFNFSGGTVTAPVLYSTGQVWTGAAGATGLIYFGNTGTKYLNYDGTSFNLVGGGLNAVTLTTSGFVQVNGGQVLLNAANTTYLLSSGNDMFARTPVGGTLYVSNSANGAPAALSCAGLSCSAISASSTVTAFSVTAARGDNSYQYYINGAARSWGIAVLSSGAVTIDDISGAASRLTIDIAGALIISGGAYKPGGGAWLATSDARIKNELGEYTRGLAEITALRPVYYTYKGNDTATAPAQFKTGDEAKDEISASLPLTVPYPNSAHKTAAEAGTKYAGLIAQEVEAVIPEMVTKRRGYIDGAAVEDLRDLDTTPLIFALINAVKELKARIEVLEAP